MVVVENTQVWKNVFRIQLGAPKAPKSINLIQISREAFYANEFCTADTSVGCIDEVSMASISKQWIGKN